jgi:hypothetical protein
MFLLRKINWRRRYWQVAGFNLTEIAMALGVMGLILGLIWVAAGALFLNDEIRVTNQQLETITHNIRTAFAEQGGVTDTGGGALTQALDQLRAFPLDMRQNPTTPTGVIFNIWSQATGGGLGSVSVDADNCAGTADVTAAPQPCFGVTFLNIPQNACIRLVTQNSQASLGLQQIEINGAVAGIIGNAVKPLPVPASTAEAGCNNGNANGSNNILWIYSVKSVGS